MTGSAPGAAPAPLSTSDERLWASLAHFGNILGVLPSLLILGPHGAVMRSEAKRVLNFVRTAAIGFVALAIVSGISNTILVVMPTSRSVVVLGLLIALVGLLQLALWVVVAVVSIISGVRVNGGGASRYPFSLHLVK